MSHDDLPSPADAAARIELSSWSPGADARTAESAAPLIDPFGRRITYLRLSVTDRCDLRCVYCMAEHPVFLPKAEVLSIEELDRLATAFVDVGVRKIRLTGGEPLVRRGFMTLVEGLSRHLRTGSLEELTLTTNGTLLARDAADLARFGIRRVNVSVDSLDPAVFKRITRGGDLAKVLAGIEAAKAAGIHVKINTVALAHDNADALPDLIAWAHGQGMDVTLIEAMPMGDIDEDRVEQFLSLLVVRDQLEQRWTLEDIPFRTGGPARYVRIKETGGKLGFITPLSHNFCESCNRVRVTCTGTMYMCLGQEDAVDLRAPLRESEGSDAILAALRAGIAHKPKGHDFRIERGAAPAVGRTMSVTGG
jgi:cyclic pyranopterin phosphate synthase